MPEKRNETQIFTDFMMGLNICTDAATQLVHQFQNPKWVAVRDYLNIIRDNISNRIGNQVK